MYQKTSQSLPNPYEDVIALVDDIEVESYMYPNKTWKYDLDIKFWRRKTKQS